MRIVATVCALSLCAIGCTSVRSDEDAFASLHSLVKQTLADTAECGPIVTNEFFGCRYFEVSPQPRGLRITVSEKQFLSEREWERRFTAATNLMSEFMDFAQTNHVADTNHPVAEAANRFSGITNLFGLSDLPQGSYHSAGVNVSVQQVDEVYSGLQEDDAEARKRYKKIISLLTPYRRSTQ